MGNILNHMVQFQDRLDRTFAAVADPTRRGILERLGRREATITDLATAFDMTLTGMRKHILVLEASGLVATAKVGRVRTCRVGPHRLDSETEWMQSYREIVEDRLDHLGEFLERTRRKGA
jgi:DNA-binding transcriptional ArsR family regulator